MAEDIRLRMAEARGRGSCCPSNSIDLLNDSLAVDAEHKSFAY